MRCSRNENLTALKSVCHRRSWQAALLAETTNWHQLHSQTNESGSQELPEGWVQSIAVKWEGYWFIYLGKNHQNNQQLVIFNNILGKVVLAHLQAFWSHFSKAGGQLIHGSWWPKGLLICRQEAIICTKHTELNAYRRADKSWFWAGCPRNLPIRQDTAGDWG